MIVIKPGNYEPELEGTCPRCGQVERFSKEETVMIFGDRLKQCGCCGHDMVIEKVREGPEPINRPSAGAMRDFLIQIQYHTAAAQAELLLETFDIRRKK